MKKDLLKRHMYSLQATNGSISGNREGFFCRSQIGAEGRERHTYGLCNGGCYEDDEGEILVVGQCAPHIFKYMMRLHEEEESARSLDKICREGAGSCPGSQMGSVFKLPSSFPKFPPPADPSLTLTLISINQ